MDTYSNYAELRQHVREGTEYRVITEVRSDSRITIIAPHGGGIEPGTSELVRAVAGADHTLALFEGVRVDGNNDLHLTSTRFDEPRCVHVASQADHVLSIHGEVGLDEVTYIGGRDSTLRDAIAIELTEAGFDVRIHDDPNLQGISTANICNRGRTGMGVQLELARGLRRTFFLSLARSGRQQTTPEFDTYVAAVRKGLQAVGDDNPHG